MNKILKIITVLTILLILFKIIRVFIASKNNQRISKYTVNNNRNEKHSLGERIAIFYYKSRTYLVNTLMHLKIMQKVSKYYEKYIHTNIKNDKAPYEIIANKISLSFIFGFIYIISAIYKSSFDFSACILSLFVGYFAYNIYLIIHERHRNTQIENDLLKSIIIMNNAFKSGYNITQAITMVTKDLTGPISEEFAKINTDLKYGLEIKEVFDRFYERVNVKDASYITSSLSLLNLTGGNLIPIFSSIEKSFTNKKRVKDELKSLTSSSKLVYYFLLVMPIVLCLILVLLSPTYFKPLISNPLGIFVIVLALTLYISYILIIKKIMKVEV